MNAMYKRISNYLEGFIRFIILNPIKVIAIMSFLMMIPISHLLQVKLDTSIIGLLHKENPNLVVYDELRRQFGRDEKIIIGIESDSIFSLEFLEALKDLHTEIEDTTPNIEKVTSLYNIRHTRGEKDQLNTDDLLIPFPQTQKEVDSVKEKAMSSILYKNLLISKDGRMTTIIVETNVYSYQKSENINVKSEFDEMGFEEDFGEQKEKQFLTEQENRQTIDFLRAIVKKYNNDGFKIYLAGSPVMTESLTSQLMSDMTNFTGSVFFIIVLFLFLIYRRVSVIAYSLLIVTLSLLITVGLMGWNDVNLKLPTQILPSLLLAVGMSSSIHIFSIFYDKYNITGDKEESLVYAFKHSGLPITITSLTTALGVGSFVTSSVAPISDLGLYGSIGILVSFILVIFLLPALLSLTNLKKINNDKRIYDKFMIKLSKITVTHYKSILGISFLLIVISVFYASKIELSHNMLMWFPEKHTDRISTKKIDEAMNGSITLEVIIDTGKIDGWKDSVRLKKLDQLSTELEKYIDKYSYIGKVISLPTIVKETNRALHENKKSFYTIPQNKDLIAQELFLFETSGNDDLEDVVDSQFISTKVTIKLPWIDAVKSVGVLHHIKQRMESMFPDDDIKITGMMQLLIQIFSSSVSSTVQSYLQAIFAITLIMMLIFKSIRIGLVSMIPNLTPIILGLCVMYTADIPLDMFTLLIGSIAIGLAVDDTIHFTYNFRKYYLKTQDYALSIEKTFLTAGKAMVTTTIILSLGFLAYLMAEMSSIQNFGFLTATVIIIALIADILLAPALMIVVAKKGWIK